MDIRSVRAGSASETTIPFPLQIPGTSAIRTAVGGMALLLFLSAAAAVAADSQQAIGDSGTFFDVSQLDSAPRQISASRPEYPAECRAQGITGTVVIDF